MTLITLLPFVGALLAAVLPSNARNAEAWLADLVAIGCMALVVSLAPEAAAGGVIRETWAWAPQSATSAEPGKPPIPRHVAMNWAQRLKRVFGIEIDTCVRCGGTLRIIASIEEPEVIAKLLAHLERTAPQPHSSELPLGARAPPVHSRLP